VIASVSFLPLLVTRPSALQAIRWWVGGIMFLARTVVRITYRVEGRENIPPGPCIIAGQHQAAYETFRVFLELDRPVLVLKRELTWIPLIGWYMRRSGLVPINRGAAGRAMRQMLRAADAAIARDDQVVIFPEGTRTAPGEHKPYRPGVFALYNHCKAPTIPLALNTGHLWGRSRILKLPGEIVFRFLPALPQGLDRDDMMAELRTRLESADLS
jgi:1-acyl-sn-glycerol-3-phosphate acyltransferase